jgi:2-methylcitrate dehydratase PrpD
MLDAAFVNAIGANLLDYDDTHLNTVIHPTAPVAPALLALAEQRGLSGAAVLHGFILGVEVECRLGNAVSPGHYARGWHITSTCGVFGAAAGSARLLELSAAQTAHALAIAASQSCGLVENLTTGAKNIAVGNAARNGLLAALFAARGVSGAPRAIEGPRGWAIACGDQPDLSALTCGLGESWELLKNTYKPYPCGIVLHSVIDACLDLRREHGLAADDVAGVTVLGNALLLARGDRAVANERDARVSIQHSVAVCLLFGAAGVREFSAEIVSRPEVAALRTLVRPVLDAALPTGAATVRIETHDGRTLCATVTHARGSLEQPLTDRDLEDKVRALGGACAEIDAVIDLIWRLDTPADLTRLMGLLG